MKIVRWLFLLALPMAVISCTDTREELVLKENGSGTLAVRTDLGRLLEIMKNFSGDSSLAQGGLDKVYDTSLQMKDYIDTAQGMTAQQKKALRNGSVHVVMNIKDNIGKFDMKFPFSSATELNEIYATMSSTTNGLKSMMGDMGKNMPNGSAQDSSSSTGMPQISSVYDIAITPNSYSRKVNKEKYQAFSNTVKPEELSQVSALMGGGMDYTFTITLPRKVKNVSNKKAVISDDKKTVTLKTDLLECFQHPELLELDLTY